LALNEQQICTIRLDKCLDELVAAQDQMIDLEKEKTSPAPLSDEEELTLNLDLVSLNRTLVAQLKKLDSLAEEHQKLDRVLTLMELFDYGNDLGDILLQVENTHGEMRRLFDDLNHSMKKIWDYVRNFDDFGASLTQGLINVTLTCAKAYELYQKNVVLATELRECEEEKLMGCQAIFHSLEHPDNCTNLKDTLADIETLLMIDQKASEVPIMFLLCMALVIESVILVIITFCSCNYCVTKKCLKKKKRRVTAQPGAQAQCQGQVQASRGIIV